MDVSRVVALETGRVENEPRGAEFEDAVPVAAVAEHLTALPLREDTVLLALVGLALTEGGGEGDDVWRQQEPVTLLTVETDGAPASICETLRHRPARAGVALQ